VELTQLVIQRVFAECEKHMLRIRTASADMVSMMPLTEHAYSNLNDEQVRVVDQFLFRFSKLQDVVGEKLFKTLLLLLDEPVENLPFLDILNRLEKLELIESAQTWRELRYDRNDLAHNYEDDPVEAANLINNLYNKREVLFGFVDRIKKYYEEHLKE